MKKQTSVDWLAEQFEASIKELLKDLKPSEAILITRGDGYDKILQTARQMHREEVEEAFVAGDERGTGEIPFNAEQYYTQTFKTP